MNEITYRASKTSAQFHRGNGFVRGLVGPVGSGKSVACCWELVAKAQAQKPGPDGVRRSRWAVVRNTYRELQDTTLNTWRDWFPISLGTWKAGEMIQTIETDDLHVEILFRALDRPDDVKKLLSLELTGAWVNEAREVPKAVIDMLQGRIGRYPSKRDGGPTWYGLIMDTNPPDVDHWWYRLFEEVKPEGWEIYHQPSGLSDRAENVENLPDGYYTRMMAGKTDEWIKVYVHGEYGFVQDGKPIYPEYQDSTHAAGTILQPMQGHTLYIGIDFGLTPAALFGQRVNGRWYILDELVASDMGASRFADELGQILRSKYGQFETEIYGDPAGDQRAQTDERTPFQILRAKGIAAKPAPSNDFTLRRESVAVCLMRLCMDGKPAFQISPACRMFRKGMSGGYRYKRIQVSGEEKYHDKPDKNIYSHVCEAGQYMFIGAGEGKNLIKSARNNQKVPAKANNLYNPHRAWSNR